MTPCRVLGLDPGSRVAGYGILDVAGPSLGVVAHGAIRLRGGSLPERLLTLYAAMDGLVEQHRPRVLAVETLFHGKSFESVLKLGHARGIVLCIGALHGMQVEEYTPATIKRTITGNGRASKSQVQNMVARVLRLDGAPPPVDAADALALAYCHGQRLWRDGMVKPAGPPPEPSRARRLLEELTSAANTRRGRRP